MQNETDASTSDMNQTEASIIEQWSFILRFDSHDSDAAELRGKVQYFLLGRYPKKQFSKQDFSNSLFEYIHELINKYFRIPGCHVNIANYKERYGSFEASFSIIAFLSNTFITYGSIRQSIDYFVKDMNGLNDLLFRENNIGLSVSAVMESRRQIHNNGLPDEEPSEFVNIYASKLNTVTKLSKVYFTSILALMSIIIALLAYQLSLSFENASHISKIKEYQTIQGKAIADAESRYTGLLLNNILSSGIENIRYELGC